MISLMDSDFMCSCKDALDSHLTLYIICVCVCMCYKWNNFSFEVSVHSFDPGFGHFLLLLTKFYDSVFFFHWITASELPSSACDRFRGTMLVCVLENSCEEIVQLIVFHSFSWGIDNVLSLHLGIGINSSRGDPAVTAAAVAAAVAAGLPEGWWLSLNGWGRDEVCFPAGFICHFTNVSLVVINVDYANFEKGQKCLHLSRRL